MLSHARRRTSAVRGFASLAIAAGLVLGTGATAGAVGPVPVPTPEGEQLRSSFMLPVLPDTQFYSRYSASQFVPKYGTNPFEVQNNWIVENKDELNIPFVAHVGDVVDQQWVGGEWDAAEKAMRILTDGGVPYSVLPGNHDVENQGARSSADNARNYRGKFGAAAMQRQAGSALIGTFQDGLSSAYIFEAEGRQWMSLAIAWNASDDTFDWAQGILDAHPGVPVILSSHAIINIAEDQVSPAYWWWGDVLWNELIKSNDQILLTVNGHFHGATMQTRVNDAGHSVYQVLTDYQMAADGGNGITTLFEFDLTNDRIDVETVSPWATVKDEASRASSDAPVLNGPWQSFSLAMDFEERFGWTLDSKYETKPDLSERAKKIVSEGWDGDANGGELQPAGNASDYIEVDGTVAHWRFGSVAEGVVDENTVVPDVAGDSPMYRNAIANTDAPDQLEDVNITHQNTAFYSADQGAVCFSPTYRNASGPDRVSFLTTEYGAPATFVDLNASAGYTIETFAQLDGNWTEAANRWGAAITRGGTRSWTGINDSSDAGAGVAWLGISNLREYQYSAADSRTANSYTLWSGEIMQGAWHHIAIVNDPAANTAVMYVDGVPVLRNASNVGGMMAADFAPWIIGASTWNTEPEHGWHGCVGETRVVERALGADEFLYNRIDIDGSGANFTLATDLSKIYEAGTQVDTFTGTGYPGSSVRVENDDATRGEATVAADGSWTITLSQPLAGAGTHDLSFVQSIGTRDGKPLEAVLAIGEKVEWAPAEGDLTADLEGRITVAPAHFEPGESISIALPEGFEGRNTFAFAFSTPIAIGEGTVTGDATVRMTTSTSVPAGQHRVALYTDDGELIGWTTVQIVAPVEPPVGGGTGDQGAGDPGTDTAQGALAMTGTIVPVAVIALAFGAILAGALTVRARRRAS